MGFTPNWNSLTEGLLMSTDTKTWAGRLKVTSPSTAAMRVLFNHGTNTFKAAARFWTSLVIKYKTLVNSTVATRDESTLPPHGKAPTDSKESVVQNGSMSRQSASVYISAWQLTLMHKLSNAIISIMLGFTYDLDFCYKYSALRWCLVYYLNWTAPSLRIFRESPKLIWIYVYTNFKLLRFMYSSGHHIEPWIWSYHMLAYV